eukprot:8540351-Karenia_brevis.AAC.1
MSLSLNDFYVHQDLGCHADNMYDAQPTFGQREPFMMVNMVWPPNTCLEKMNRQLSGELSWRIRTLRTYGYVKIFLMCVHTKIDLVPAKELFRFGLC